MRLRCKYRTMLGILFYTVLCLRCGFVAGVFEITSGRYLTIPEKSTSNVQLQVTTNVDTIPVPDGQNNTVAFSVIEQTPADPEDAFYFSSTSLGKLANQPLDYELHKMYQVVIEAVPRVGTNATQTLEVTVTDVNEHPSCQTNYNIAVTDGDTNDPDIVTVCCTDVDAGQTLTYTLDDNYNLFAIHTTGTIGLASGVTVNRTELTGVNYRYTLGITATDNGSPPLSQTASATVKVKEKPKSTSDAVPTAIINVILTFVSSLLVFALA